jgi:hypothetical protein
MVLSYRYSKLLYNLKNTNMYSATKGNTSLQGDLGE